MAALFADFADMQAEEIEANIQVTPTARSECLAFGLLAWPPRPSTYAQTHTRSRFVRFSMEIFCIQPRDPQARKTKIYLLMEEARRLRIQQKVKGLQEKTTEEVKKERFSSGGWCHTAPDGAYVELMSSHWHFRRPT